VTPGTYLLPLRHPVISARAAITAQQIGGGRFRLGLGAGWWDEEAECLGVPPDERWRRYREALRVLPKLFTGEWVENPGPAYPFPSLRLTEEPIHIPLIFGGTGPNALKRAARMGAGWYGPMVPVEEALRLKREIEGLRAEAGLTTPFVFEERVRGEPSRDALKAYIDAGFDTLVIPCETFQGDLGFDMTLDQKFRRAEEIARALDIG
jgi:alkanesulfonate monooxygenase SsuD/methylene tetrahydromethanopterin reductase-like flavin-dependent oxidoreductase (luciferase family)